MVNVLRNTASLYTLLVFSTINKPKHQGLNKSKHHGLLLFPSCVPEKVDVIIIIIIIIKDWTL